MSERENAINLYKCDTCRGEIVTVNRADGVTPFMLECHATDGCKGVMRSAMYLVDQATVPLWEWYRPLNLHGLNDWWREHVEKGGLVLQRIPPNTHNIGDPNLRRCVEFVQGLDYISASMLQRQFRFTYMTAARLLDDLIRRRFIDRTKDKLGRHQVVNKKAAS